MRVHPFRKRIHCRHYCERCGCTRTFRKRVVDHASHFTLTYLTLGLWIVVWLWARYMRRASRWRCLICGTTGRRPEHTPAEFR